MTASLFLQPRPGSFGVLRQAGDPGGGGDPGVTGARGVSVLALMLTWHW
ncbi:MAG TPA: hypothetical protein VEH29_09860 [Acidimicrobiales bacterium]|nr:hypothetical protein [Acidimicrobiales bacterium]